MEFKFKPKGSMKLSLDQRAHGDHQINLYKVFDLGGHYFYSLDYSPKAGKLIVEVSGKNLTKSEAKEMARSELKENGYI